MTLCESRQLPHFLRAINRFHAVVILVYLCRRTVQFI